MSSLLSIGFTSLESLTLVLTSLLLKFPQKRPKFAYLVQKMIERLKLCKNETKPIDQIQFVVERSKPDLYGLLEGMFGIFPDFNIFTFS